MSFSDWPAWGWSAMSLGGRGVVLVGVLFIVLRCRRHRPRAARLFLAALGLRGIVSLASVVILANPFAVRAVEWQGGIPDFSHPAMVQWMIIQAISTGDQIAFWSLIAWAILRRPDAVSPQALAHANDLQTLHQPDAQARAE